MAEVCGLQGKMKKACTEAWIGQERTLKLLITLTKGPQ